MGYSKSDDKTVRKIGKIVLTEQPKSVLHLELKQYKGGDIKLAMVFEGEQQWGKKEGEPYFTTKIPRLSWEEVRKLKNELPKLLEDAYIEMDNLA